MFYGNSTDVPIPYLHELAGLTRLMIEVTRYEYNSAKGEEKKVRLYKSSIFQDPRRQGDCFYPSGQLQTPTEGSKTSPCGHRILCHFLLLSHVS